jgi:hypothetical protein
MWTGFIWLRIEISGGILRTFGFNEVLGISCVAEQLLASQEGIASMKLLRS